MNSPSDKMSEWIVGGWSRAIAQAVRAIDRELAALQRVDFRKGWLQGNERRRFRRFMPDRVLENLAFALPDDHELWSWPVVRELQLLSALYLEETPSRTALLSALKAVREGADELRAELRRMVQGLEVTLNCENKLLGPPCKVANDVSANSSRQPPRSWPTTTAGPLFPQPPSTVRS